MLTNLDRDLLYLSDPVCRVEDRFDIDFNLDPVQKEYLRCTSKRILVKCCRQWGKSTVAAMRGAAAFEEGKGLILIVAPTDRQARECFAKCSAMIHAANPNEKFKVDGRTEIERYHGARLVAIPTKGQIRGFSSPRKIIMDEAAFSADEDYKGKIRPMLSHGGQVELLSTPFGKRGFFWEQWERGGSSWKRFEVPASECSHIPRDFLEEERLALGPIWYSQEYEGVFLDSVSSFFDMDAVRAGLQVGIEPLFLYTPQGSTGADPDIQPLFKYNDVA
jgi:hypothetical protein